MTAAVAGGGKKICFNQSACIVRAQIGVLIWTNATEAGQAEGWHRPLPPPPYNEVLAGQVIEQT